MLPVCLQDASCLCVDGCAQVYSLQGILLLLGAASLCLARKQQTSTGRQWHLALCSKNLYCLCHTQSKLLITLLDHECDIMSLTFTAGKDRAARCISCAQTQITLPHPWRMSSWLYGLYVLKGVVWSKAVIYGFIQYFAHRAVIPVGTVSTTMVKVVGFVITCVNPSCNSHHLICLVFQGFWCWSNLQKEDSFDKCILQC